jgi:nucleotide-binding universal stress UspA family protein
LYQEKEMYKKMLVLLDGSKLAEVVFSYAQELAGRLDLSIDFLNVCRPEEETQIPMRRAYVVHMAEKLAQNLTGSSLQATGHVLVGYPAEEILKYAHDTSVDLIMLATHGLSGIRRWGIGSVADKIIHETEVPVWLIPSQLHETILYDKDARRSILVPLDGSKMAETVLPHVKELVKQRGEETEVLLINVSTESIMPRLKSNPPDQILGEKLGALSTRAEIYLNRIAADLKSEGIKTRVEQLVGNPADEIVGYAAERHPRMIVMSTHGRSGFSRFVFSSVTENVLHRLQKTPLFLIRPTGDVIQEQSPDF